MTATEKMELVAEMVREFGSVEAVLSSLVDLCVANAEENELVGWEEASEAIESIMGEINV